MNKKVNRVFILTGIIFFLAFTVNSCIPAEPEIPDLGDIEIERHLTATGITANFQKSSMNCPRDFTGVGIYCGKSRSSCTADSVLITNPHPSLDAFIEGSLNGASLEANADKAKILTVKYNCQVESTFEHTYKVFFFSNGNKIAEENLEVRLLYEN